MGQEISYVDINHKQTSHSIETIFPGWKYKKERVCVFSPHDDDAIIGAGYAMEASKRNGAQMDVMIFCRGNAGYSMEDQREKIIELRKEETLKAYSEIGILEENIIRFDFSDFSAIHDIGWILNNGCEGGFKSVVTELRRRGITRVMLPNHYREHIDHFAVSMMGAYYTPQAGDAVVIDWGKPQKIASVLEYSVWADLSPEDCLVEGRKSGLRANRMVIVDEGVEERIRRGIGHYKSQEDIIRRLTVSREERRCKDGRYIEVYLHYDPRPKLDYAPYREFIEGLER